MTRFINHIICYLVLVACLQPAEAGEPAFPGPLDQKVKAADYIFTAIATKITTIRNGKRLTKAPVDMARGDTMEMELEISEVFTPSTLSNKNHLTILLCPTYRGGLYFVYETLNKKMIYLLQKESNGFTPAYDFCEPAVAPDLRDKVLFELSKKQESPTSASDK